MMAYTGHWSVPRFVADEQAKLARVRKEARHAHRSLNRRERMLKDLLLVDEMLRREMKAQRHAVSYRGVPSQARMRTLLRRRNRLVDGLNRWNGASQQVAAEQVS